MRQALDFRRRRGAIKKIAYSTERTGIDYKMRPAPNKRWMKYFFANGKLHKLIQYNRGQDLLVAWCYVDKCRYSFSYTDIQRNAQKAYSLKEVQELIGRHKTYIHRLIMEEVIETPQRTYTLDGNYRPGKYFMSEDDVMELHEYFSTTHVGRPRSDGLITHWGDLPTKVELRAAMQSLNGQQYIKHKGELVPVWKGAQW